MDDELFDGRKRIQVRAINLAERIDLTLLDTTNRIAISPVVVRAGTSGCAVVFRHGAVVLFGMMPLEEAALLSDLTKLVREPHPTPAEERIDVEFDADQEERVDGNVIYLRTHSLERIQIIADILGDSVVLEYYENLVAATFDQVEPLALELERGRQGVRRSKDLLKRIGGAMLVEHRMVGRIEVGEKPDVLWDRPDLEPLYARLAKEYELKERQQALGRKLNLISRTVETVLDLLQQRRNLRVEWYIVLLIVVEILLTLYEMFVRHR